MFPQRGCGHPAELRGWGGGGGCARGGGVLRGDRAALRQVNSRANKIAIYSQVCTQAQGSHRYCKGKISLRQTRPSTVNIFVWMNSHKKVSSFRYLMTSNLWLYPPVLSGCWAPARRSSRGTSRSTTWSSASSSDQRVFVSVNIWIINEFCVKTPRTVVQCWSG